MQKLALTFLLTFSLFCICYGGNYTKTALLVESRCLPTMVPLILHFGLVLGEDWSIRVYHTPENEYLFDESEEIQKEVQKGRIELIKSTNIYFRTHIEISRFLFNISLWESLAPATHVLIFQMDSMICNNSKTRPEDFFKYDMIGSGLDDAHGRTINGGLSLRKRESIIRLLTLYPWDGNHPQEDQYFFHHFKVMNGTVLPEPDEAMLFSVESRWYPTPLGWHQVDRFLPHKMSEVLAYCPEYDLTTRMTLGAGNTQSPTLLCEARPPKITKPKVPEVMNQTLPKTTDANMPNVGQLGSGQPGVVESKLGKPRAVKP